MARYTEEDVCTQIRILREAYNERYRDAPQPAAAAAAEAASTVGAARPKRRHRSLSPVAKLYRQLEEGEIDIAKRDAAAYPFLRAKAITELEAQRQDVRDEADDRQRKRKRVIAEQKEHLAEQTQTHRSPHFRSRTPFRSPTLATRFRDDTPAADSAAPPQSYLPRDATQASHRIVNFLGSKAELQIEARSLDARLADYRDYERWFGEIAGVNLTARPALASPETAVDTFIRNFAQEFLRVKQEDRRTIRAFLLERYLAASDPNSSAPVVRVWNLVFSLHCPLYWSALRPAIVAHAEVENRLSPSRRLFLANIRPYNFELLFDKEAGDE
jgi:hypothetical protein